MLLFVKEKLARIQPRPPAPFLSLQEKRGKGTTRRTRLQVATRNGLADPNPLTARPLLPVGPLSLLLWALPNRTLLSPSLPFPSALPLLPRRRRELGRRCHSTRRRAFLPGKQGDLRSALLPFPKVRSEEGLLFLFLFLFPQPPPRVFAFPI